MGSQCDADQSTPCHSRGIHLTNDPLDEHETQHDAEWTLNMHEHA